MSGESKYLQGRLLLDSGQLRGSYFQRTVVLVCRHNAEGAFGLVLNRPSGNSLGEMVTADLPEAFREHPLYLGGPVELGAFSYLHADEFLPGDQIIDNVVMGHSLEELDGLAGSFSPHRQLKMFAGYSGWSAGQLEGEMERSAWLTHPATRELLFDTDPAELWRTVLRQMGPRFRVLAEMPEDPSRN